MNLELDAAELDAVRDALSSTIRDLSPEIADTDNPQFRRELKARRDLLVAVVARLSAG
jgi:hypothetical protein